MPKTGLKSPKVSKDHFSNTKKIDPPFSRIVIRFLDGKQLLASDVVSGKSDPVGFAWCGYRGAEPQRHEWNEFLSENSGILTTKTCKTTVDPIWNEDLTFPIDLTDLDGLAEFRCLIHVRDEDENTPNVFTYEDLGMVEISLKDIIARGKVIKNSIVDSSKKYDLQKTLDMRRVDGSIRLTISIFFLEDDVKDHYSRLGSDIANVEKFTSQLQKCLKSGGLPSKDDALNTTSISEGSRGRQVRNTAPKIAARPSTAPAKIATIATIEEDDAEAANDDFNGTVDDKYDWEKDDALPRFDGGTAELITAKGSEDGVEGGAGSRDPNAAEDEDDFLSDLERIQRQIISADSSSLKAALDLGETILGITSVDAKLLDSPLPPAPTGESSGSATDAPPQAGEVLTEAVSSGDPETQVEPVGNELTAAPSSSSSSSSSAFKTKLQDATAGAGGAADIDRQLEMLQLIRSQQEQTERLLQAQMQSQAQGNAASAIRALRELAWQRDQVKEILMELARLTKTGFSRVSKRIDGLEALVRTSSAATATAIAAAAAATAAGNTTRGSAGASSLAGQRLEGGAGGGSGSGGSGGGGSGGGSSVGGSGSGGAESRVPRKAKDGAAAAAEAGDEEANVISGAKGDQNGRASLHTQGERVEESATSYTDSDDRPGPVSARSSGDQRSSLDDPEQSVDEGADSIAAKAAVRQPEIGGGGGGGGAKKGRGSGTKNSAAHDARRLELQKLKKESLRAKQEAGLVGAVAAELVVKDPDGVIQSTVMEPTPASPPRSPAQLHAPSSTQAKVQSKVQELAELVEPPLFDDGDEGEGLDGDGEQPPSSPLSLSSPRAPHTQPHPQPRGPPIASPAPAASDEWTGSLNWAQLGAQAKRGDASGAFSRVLERGDLSDLNKLMEVTGPHLESLSPSLRNRVFEGVAVLLRPSRSSSQQVERALIWTLALVRGHSGPSATTGPPGSSASPSKSRGTADRLFAAQASPAAWADRAASTTTGQPHDFLRDLAQHVQSDLASSLRETALQPGKVGLLASLLLKRLAAE